MGAILPAYYNLTLAPICDCKPSRLLFYAPFCPGLLGYSASLHPFCQGQLMEGSGWEQINSPGSDWTDPGWIPPPPQLQTQRSQGCRRITMTSQFYIHQAFYGILFMQKKGSKLGFPTIIFPLFNNLMCLMLIFLCPVDYLRHGFSRWS